ncbi:Retinoic acid induced 16-like protein-domain-containing protein [Pilobolus umbonatus]|nr:Retinoic acid induced 16-like protein-domain-containing protein [Pilobolus umbonatus]
MDYFSKFRMRIVPPKVQFTSAMHLAKFHKCWDYVHNIFIAEDRKANLHIKQTEISEKLRQMVDMLVDEEARQEDNSTGVCMEYFLKNGVLHYLVNVSEKMDYPEGIRGESIRTIASMVDLLDDRFLVHNAIHKPTIKLLRFCVLDERQSELDHEDLVDLMYIICSKIHGFPALLNIFFHDKQWLIAPQKKLNQSSGSTRASSRPSPTTEEPPEYEFLLFSYLLRFVHREGRSGDFARTGLLFLMEMAVDQLGEFILESDFTSIMAAGLGALYSQLPRKLVIKDESEINSTPASYLLGQDLDPRSFPSELGVERSNSEQFKYQLDSFLKLLEFCQDVLTRCPNGAISEKLLQCVKMIFLENILYPSIMECSDIDGSSVAVVSYIEVILQTIHQPDLAEVIVGFLMGTDSDDTNSGKSNRNSISTVDKHNMSPYFTAVERFTLKDLIFTRLNSSSQPTVIATLKLLRTLITKHCRSANKLLSIIPEERNDGNPSAIISHHIREIDFYFSLISSGDSGNRDDILTLGYEDYLRDLELNIENDCCFQNSRHQTGVRISHMHNPQNLSSLKSKRRRSFKYGQREGISSISSLLKDDEYLSHRQNNAQHLYRHRIQPSDTLIQILLRLLSHFFAQSSELNLALTGVISSLAMCPYRCLEGWLTFSETDRTNPNDVIDLSLASSADKNQLNVFKSYSAEDLYSPNSNMNYIEEEIDDDQSIDFGSERNSAKMTGITHFRSFPLFYTLFKTLTQQMDYYKSEIDEFDKLLEERRNVLLFGDSEYGAFSFSGYTAPTPTLSHRRSSLFEQPVTLLNTGNTGASTGNLATTSSGVSKLFGLSSKSSNGNISHNRKTSLSLKTSSSYTIPLTQQPSSTPLTPPNPSKSLSSSTTAAVMAAVNGSSSTPAASLNIHNNHHSHGYSSSHIPPTPSIFPINPLSSLAIHAKKTLGIRIQPLLPSNFDIDKDEPILSLDKDDEDTFVPKPSSTNPSQFRRLDKSTEISLSMLLNNAVILEECIKELVAIIQVRRSLGIDKIRYV